MDTIGPTVLQLQNILNSPPLNSTNLGALKSQLQTIAYSLDTFRQANLSLPKVTDVPGTLQRIHDLLLTQPVSATAGRNAESGESIDRLQNQLVALQDDGGTAVHSAVSNINSVFDMLPPDAWRGDSCAHHGREQRASGIRGALVTRSRCRDADFGNRVLKADSTIIGPRPIQKWQ
jgi:hypothetical protein